MLTAYIQAAMRRAHYEMLDDHEGFYGSIPECQGVWAQADTLEACREELQEVLEGWIILSLRLGHAFPVIAGLDLTPPLEVVDEEAAEQEQTKAPTVVEPPGAFPYGRHAVDD